MKWLCLCVHILNSSVRCSRDVFYIAMPPILANITYRRREKTPCATASVCVVHCKLLRSAVIFVYATDKANNVIQNLKNRYPNKDTTIGLLNIDSFRFAMSRIFMLSDQTNHAVVGNAKFSCLFNQQVIIEFHINQNIFRTRRAAT